MNFENVLENSIPEVIEIAHFLRKLVLDLHPEIEEDFYGGQKVKMSMYSIGPKNNPIAVIGSGGTHCKLFLHHTDRVETYGLKLEGKGKYSKHIKFFKMRDIIEEDLLKVLTNIVKIVVEKAKAYSEK